MILLHDLTKEVAIEAAAWRNASPESCRTPKPSTPEGQAEWFDRLPSLPHKYFQISYEDEIVGIGGMTYICPVNNTAEISIVLNPQRRGDGFGREAVNAILRFGFDALNIDVIYGECYLCSKSIGFWLKVLSSENDVRWSILPDRKFWRGRYWDSLYFSIRRKI